MENGRREKKGKIKQVNLFLLSRQKIGDSSISNSDSILNIIEKILQSYAMLLVPKVRQKSRKELNGDRIDLEFCSAYRITTADDDE